MREYLNIILIMNKNIKFEWKVFDKLSNNDLYAILHLRQEVFGGTKLPIS